MVSRTFVNVWFKKFWLIFEFHLIIAFLVNLLLSLIIIKSNMLCSYEKKLV